MRAKGKGAGKHTIVFDFKSDGPGLAKGGTSVLSVDVKEVARNTMDHTTPNTFPEDETFDIGQDTRTPLALLEYRYEVPLTFTGTIDKLALKLEPFTPEQSAEAGARPCHEMGADLRCRRGSRKLAGFDIVRVQSGQFAGQQRISKTGRSLLRWALYQAALGVAHTAAGRARLLALKAQRAGDRHAGLKAMVELAAKQLRLVWGVWRSGHPYNPLRAGGSCRPRR